VEDCNYIVVSATMKMNVILGSDTENTASPRVKKNKKERGRSKMNTAEYSTTTPEPFVLHRQIGSTTFRVKLHFIPDSKETLDEKVKRLLKNDLQSAAGSITIEPLQAGWLSERSSA